MAANSS